MYLSKILSLSKTQLLLTKKINFVHLYQLFLNIGKHDK